MELLLQTIFWSSIGLAMYVYVGYPMLVFALARIRPRKTRKADIEPTLSLIITAYNEERAIRQKIENSLALDYPKERLEIIVASDCSGDRTDEIVEEYEERRVELVRQPHRGGKTAAQNLAVEHAAGEIIVFSDATSMYRPDALRMLVRNFADESVGCVAGKLIYVDPEKTDVGTGARSYWEYETLLKESESRVCSLIGVSGCIYAVRRASYKPMYPEACSDFLIATVVFRQGLRTVYEPEALCTEETNQIGEKEMRMRVRVISQTFTDLWRNRDMMNPFRSGFYAVQLVSHKLLRYSVPLFITATFVSSAALAFSSFLFLIMFALQMLFLAAAASAWALERAGVRLGPLSIPYYFLLTNVASVAGFLQFLRGERYAAWEPIRDPGL